MMEPCSKNVWLVIPCYRESERLPTFLPILAEEITGARLPVAIQVVDDGSPGTEPGRLREIVEAERRIYGIVQPMIGYPVNRGKGHAIRAGWDAGTAEARWLGFVDADGAVPAGDVVMVLRRLLADDTPRILAAVRENQAGAVVERHPVRHLGSRVFQAWVRLCHQLPLRDTQCGLKFIPRTLYEAKPGTWKQSRYAFDIELLIEARRRGMPIETVPVTWHEQAVSRLHLPAAIRLFWHAWRCGR